MKKSTSLRTKSGAHTKRYEAQVARNRRYYRSEEQTKKRAEKEAKDIEKEQARQRRQWEKKRKEEYKRTGKARPTYEEQWKEYDIEEVKSVIDNFIDNKLSDYLRNEYAEWEQYKLNKITDWLNSEFVKQGDKLYIKIWENMEDFLTAIAELIGNQYEGFKDALGEDDNGVLSDAFDRIYSIVTGESSVINEIIG